MRRPVGAWLRSAGGGGHGAVLSRQLRHAPAVLGAALSATAVLQRFLTKIVVGDDWPRGMSHVGDALLDIGLPFVVAVAYWLGGADARHGTGWLDATASRGPLTRLVMKAAPAVLWPLAGYVVVVAVVGVTASGSAYPGSLPVDAVVSDVALQTAAACVSYALGRAVPLRFVPPLIWGLLFFSGWTFVDRSRLSPTVPQSYRARGVPGASTWSPAVPPWWLPWLVSALLLALAAAVLLISARRVLPATLTLLATAAGVVGGVVPHHLSHADGPPGGRLGRGDFYHFPNDDAAFFYRASPEVAPVTCNRSQPHICTVEGLSRPDGMVRKLGRRLAGVRGAPTHLVLLLHNPTRPTVPPREERARGRPWSVAASTEDDYGITASTVQDLALTIAQAPESQCARRYATSVGAWLVPPDARYGEDLGSASRLDALSPARRAAWLGAYFSGSTCAPLPKATHRVETTS